MKVFLINLDKNPERLAAADAQLRRVGVVYERFPAVYGKVLSAEECSKVYDDRWARRLTGYALQPGEIGCALSHIRIYERMVRESTPYALILEDEAYPTPMLPQILEALASQFFPSEPMVLLLGEGGSASKRGSRRQIPGTLYSMVELRRACRTHAYVVTLAAARRLARFLLPVVGPADWWGRMCAYGVVRLYAVDPIVVALNCAGGVSMVDELWGKPLSKRSFVVKWLRRGWRLWWKVYDGVRAHWARTFVWRRGGKR